MLTIRTSSIGLFFWKFILFLACYIFTALPSIVNASELTIRSENGVIQLKQKTLLSKPSVTTVKIEHDPSYGGQPMTYRALPLREIFNGISISKNATLLFKCLDGFSAPISQERLLNTDQQKAIAYLAIEDPKKPWPPISTSKNKGTPGPFYVIWKNPEGSNIGREEWPFQVIEFEIKKPLNEIHPKIFPSPNISETDPIFKGFKVFTKQCFTCHTLNLDGTSKIGPDLNVPSNPTEYFEISALKKFIRNPQDLRKWESSRMKGFDEKEISNEELDNLLHYLKHMAARRKAGSN